MSMYFCSRKPVLRRSTEPSQYTSYDFAKACRAAGVEHSMGSVADCFDNAMAESFFATLECELIDRSVFENRSQARMAIFRLHRGLLQHLAPALLDRQPLPGRV
jgi:putative transposase